MNLTHTCPWCPNFLWLYVWLYVYMYGYNNSSILQQEVHAVTPSPLNLTGIFVCVLVFSTASYLEFEILASITNIK